MGRDARGIIDFIEHFDFNPRAPVGRDVCAQLIARGDHISIPAPLWGATQRAKRRTWLCEFQSPRPCGARHSSSARLSPAALFQSPRPCGARRKSQNDSRTPHNFNPRAPVGRDGYGIDADSEKKVFQSPRPCGARLLDVIECVDDPNISIPAPLWGATAYGFRLSRQLTISIPAPLWGATCTSLWCTMYTDISIPAPLWGATKRRRARIL